MKLLALFVVALAVVSVQSQEPKFYRMDSAASDSIPQTIHFFCSQGYDQRECLRDVSALRKALAPYPLELLGEWSFYLVRAAEWKPLARSHGGPAVSPAFTLDYGVRLTHSGPFYEVNNANAAFFPDQWKASLAPRLYYPICTTGVW